MATTDTHNTDLARAEILWKAADALRGQIDAAEYKHVVLGLLFLKYISDSFENLHPDLKADYILANPPFNISDWSGKLLTENGRWRYGTPPTGNANYAWIQHFICHLAPPNGRGDGVAGFVMANGSLSSGSGGEGEIRQRIVEADLVECIVALPAQLFLTTGIPACLWFLTRDKTGRNLKHGGRNRQGETLFIDARKLGKCRPARCVC